MNPVFEPNYINVEFVFNWVLTALGYLLSFEWLTAWLGPLASLRYLFAVVAFLLVIPTVVLFVRLYNLRREEDRALALAALATGAADKTRVNQEWERVLKYLNSENSADWKLAIIEADNILDALVKKMNYPGETLGERLKAIEPSDFLTLPQAWEAHRLRNRIAHESDFELTARETRRGIALFEQVFREFDYI